MKAYLRVEQENAKPVSRQLRSAFGRLAFVTDEGTVELTVSSNGYWSVQIGPAPTRGGGFEMLARGKVDGSEFSTFKRAGGAGL